MSAREDFARAIFIADNANLDMPQAAKDWDENREHHDYAFAIADGLIAAGYSKPRTITTAEELDELAVGTVVLSDVYRYQAHGGADCGWPVSFQRWKGGDWHRGGRSSSTHPDNFLPVTVLHEPVAQA